MLPEGVRALHSVIQFQHALGGEADHADAKLRVNSDGLVYFSRKAPGLISAVIGRGQKLQAVKRHLDHISNHFESNMADLPQNIRESKARAVKSAAHALSQRVSRAMVEKGDVTAADCIALRDFARLAVA